MRNDPCMPGRQIPAPPSSVDDVGAVIGGYRLVRRIGSGPRAQVHLAVPVDAVRADGVVADGVVADGAPAAAVPVVVKCWAASTAPEVVFGEADALWSARHRHVVELIDLIDLGDGRPPALVLGRVPTPLSAVVGSGVVGSGVGRSAAGRARSPGISLGAAATVIAPLASALRAMHEAGVAHGRVEATAVRVDDHGAPVLVGFGGATRFPAGGSRAALAGEPGVVADAEGLRRVARWLIDEASRNPVGAAPGDGEATRLLRSMLDGPRVDAAIASDPTSWIERFETRVFDAVRPLPLPLATDHLADGREAAADAALDAAPDADPGRRADLAIRGIVAALDGASPSRHSVARREPATRRGAVRGRAGRVAVARWLEGIGLGVLRRLADAVPAEVRGAVARAADAVAVRVGAVRVGAVRIGAGMTAARSTANASQAPRPGVRRRVWLPAVGVLGAAGVLAAIALSGDAEPSPAPADAASTPSSVVGRGVRDAAEIAADADDADAAAADAGAADGHTDPELAVIALLQARAGCLADRDLGCLAGVVQSGSPAESADRASIAAAGVDQAASGADWRPRQAVLVDLIGAAALVDVVIDVVVDDASVRGTVPVLLVRSGTQWRIRAILGAPDDESAEAP